MKTVVAMLALVACLAITPSAVAQKTIRSSLAYTQGTKALEKGDYATAAELLGRAVELDPSLSRNHANYSAALFELGRYDIGWTHARQAVTLDPGNQTAAANQRRYLKKLMTDAGLETGASVAQVTAVLGEPDGTAQRGECHWYRYGHSALCIEDGVLTGFGDMGRKPTR